MPSNVGVFDDGVGHDLAKMALYINDDLRHIEPRAHTLVRTIGMELHRLLNTLASIKEHREVISSSAISEFVNSKDMMVAMYIIAARDCRHSRLVLRYIGMLDDVLREIDILGRDGYDGGYPVRCELAIDNNALHHTVETCGARECACCHIQVSDDMPYVPMSLAIDVTRDDIEEFGRDAHFCVACLCRRWSIRTVHIVSLHALQTFGECCFWANKDSFDRCAKRLSIIADNNKSTSGIMGRLIKFLCE